MSHHASGPNFGFPRGDARLDMTDLYAFPKPGDPGKTILILNVHPPFRLDSLEQLGIDYPIIQGPLGGLSSQRLTAPRSPTCEIHSRT